MGGEHIPEREYHKSKGPTDPCAVDCSEQARHVTPHPVPDLPGLLRGGETRGSYNAPVRVQGMQQMQRTHGNRAVQRALKSTMRGAPMGLRPVQRDRWSKWAKELGKDAWDSKYNPLKEPVDGVRNLFGGGDDGPSVHDMIMSHQIENEKKMVLLRNRAQIEKEYGASYFSMLMTNAGIRSIPMPQVITDMDQRRQQQEHDASIENAQKALTGALPGTPARVKPDEIYPDMVSK